MINTVGTLPSTNDPLLNFCDQRFKWIHVALDSVSRRCLIAFYRIIAFMVYPFSEAYFHYYSSQAKYYIEVGDRISIYNKFGNRIIDFCTNQCSQINEFFPAKVSEFQALEKQYGTDVINSWCRIGTADIPLKKENLQRCSNDLCLGISFDFIKKYLLAIKNGNSPLEAVKSISKIYVNGAPTTAQLIQIFDSALNFSMETSKLLKKQRSETDKLFEFREAEELRIKNLNIEESEIQKLLENNEAEFRKNLSSCLNTPISLDRFSPTSNFLGLKITDKYEFDNLADKDFEKSINDLAPNAYLVQISIKDTYLVHCLAFIKTTNGELYHFAQDSNFATLRIGQKQLASWFLNDLLKPYPSKRISFRSYALQDS